MGTDDDGWKGLKAQIEEAQAEQVAAFRDGDADAQMSMLPLPEFLDVDEDVEGGKRGPGRPKGARNKRAEDFIGYLRSRYSSPLEGSAQTWSRPVRQLALELDCTVYEAAVLQQRCREAALPYWEQKLPVKIDIDGVQLPTIVTMDPAAVLALLLQLPEDDPARAGIEFLAPLIEHQPDTAGAEESEEDQ